MAPATIGGDFVNPRTFELAGMGCFQLSDRRELLAPLYSDEEVVQFDDETELTELIDYYLEHQTERDEIARNAQRRTLKNHLYEHRAVEIVEAAGKLSRLSGERPA
jgi:spore maturation protein CgeB